MPSATNQDPGPPFDVGRALALSLALLTSNAGALALMTVLIHLPTLGFQLYLIAVPTVAGRAHQQQTALLMGAGMFFTALSTAAVIHRVFQQIQGKPVRFVDSLRFGLGRTTAVLLINFVTFVAMLVGGFAFVAPGLLAATMLFVAAPVAVAEGRGVLDSLRRSVELTRGSRWGVFGVLILPISVVVGLNLLTLVAVGDFHAERPLENPRFQAVNAVLSVLFQALTSVTMTVAYLELRRRREGSPDATLAASPD
jgi:hypothetical protein